MRNALSHLICNHFSRKVVLQTRIFFLVREKWLTRKKILVCRTTFQEKWLQIKWLNGCFGNAKTSWSWFRRWNSIAKCLFFWSSAKYFGISKMKWDFKNIDYLINPCQVLKDNSNFLQFKGVLMSNLTLQTLIFSILCFSVQSQTDMIHFWAQLWSHVGMGHPLTGPK